MKNMCMFVGEEEENIYVKSVEYAVKSLVCWRNIFAHIQMCALIIVIIAIFPSRLKVRELVMTNYCLVILSLLVALFRQSSKQSWTSTLRSPMQMWFVWDSLSQLWKSPGSCRAGANFGQRICETPFRMSMWAFSSSAWKRGLSQKCLGIHKNLLKVPFWRHQLDPGCLHLGGSMSSCRVPLCTGRCYNFTL